MRILFVTPEYAPFAKAGGLGDVSAALPAALRALGTDVWVLLPGYPGVLKEVTEAREVGRFNDWPTALTPLFTDAPSLLTIHNLAFQGNFGREWLGRLGLPEASFTMDK